MYIHLRSACHERYQQPIPFIISKLGFRPFCFESTPKSLSTRNPSKIRLKDYKYEYPYKIVRVKGGAGISEVTKNTRVQLNKCLKLIRNKCMTTLP
jgi:hypothetical protein